MRLPENNYVEVNFDQRVKIEEIANKKIKIVQIGNMTTKFGKKSFALLDDGRWFYITETLDHLTKQESLPFTCTISKTESKNGNSYWTSDLKPVSTNKHITELEGHEIEIIYMEPINTKYGERIKLTYWNHEDPNDATEYHTLTIWNRLYDTICELLNGDMNKLQDDPLIVRVISKKSKSDRVYMSYEDVD